MASRPALAAKLASLAAALLLAGCHAGTSGNLASSRPDAALPKIGLTTTEAIQKHNVNASRVQALRATPKIVVGSAQGGVSLSGRMALERPRFFTLQLRATGTEAANIGSNDDEFWFWTKPTRNQENNVFVCSYDDVNRAQLSSTFQPDWIVEAMGLRTITHDEASRMTSEPGPTQGTTMLVSKRRGPSNEVMTKEILIDQAGKIREHRLFQGESKKDRALLASAVISEYQAVALGAGSAETAILPKRFRLEWFQPQMLRLDIVLDGPVLLTGFSNDDRQAMFSEPDIKNSRRVNLADYVEPTAPAPRRANSDRGPALSGRSSSRTTRPAPPTGSGPEIPFGDIQPLDPARDASRRSIDDPVAASPDPDADQPAPERPTRRSLFPRSAAQ